MTDGLKEIAERAGVSMSTVSRFVAGKGIRPALRLRVEAALANGAYMPNLAARRLKARGNATLGLVVPELGNPFFLRLAEAVENFAWEAGYRLILCNSDEDPIREDRYVTLLREERIAGLMIAPAGRPRRLTTRLANLPTVVFDRAMAGGAFDTVMLENADASRDLSRALYDAGHRRIVGLFTRSPVVGARRRMGYVAAMAELGLPARTLVVGHGPAAQRTTAETALDRWPDLDVLIAGNSPGMLAVACVLKERGHPATLAGFDRADWLHLLDRPAFWIEQPTVEIAHAMVALLLDPPSAGSSRHLVFQGIVRRSS